MFTSEMLTFRGVLCSCWWQIWFYQESSEREPKSKVYGPSNEKEELGNANTLELRGKEHGLTSCGFVTMDDTFAQRLQCHF